MSRIALTHGDGDGGGDGVEFHRSDGERMWNGISLPRQGWRGDALCQCRPADKAEILLISRELGPRGGWNSFMPTEQMKNLVRQKIGCAQSIYSAKPTFILSKNALR